MKIEAFWWERANCKDADPYDFEAKRLPSGRRKQSRVGSKTAERDWAAARAICEACPVRESCFWEALAQPTTLVGPHEEMFVAGLTPEEMRVKRRHWERMRRRAS